MSASGAAAASDRCSHASSMSACGSLDVGMYAPMRSIAEPSASERSRTRTILCFRIVSVDSQTYAPLHATMTPRVCLRVAWLYRPSVANDSHPCTRLNSPRAALVSLRDMCVSCHITTSYLSLATCIAERRRASQSPRPSHPSPMGLSSPSSAPARGARCMCMPFTFCVKSLCETGLLRAGGPSPGYPRVESNAHPV